MGVRDTSVVEVALWLPAEAELQEAHGLNADGGDFLLSDGSRLALVQMSDRTEAKALLECRRRADRLLEDFGWKKDCLQKWPLHDRARASQLFSHALKAPKMPASEKAFWLQTAGRLLFLDELHDKFGAAVAGSFAWQASYLACLLVLALVSATCTAIKWFDADSYQKLLPGISFLLISWCILVTESQTSVMRKLHEHWHRSQQPTSDATSELSSEVSFHARRGISRRQWRQLGQRFTECCQRNFRFQISCVPILLMEWLFIWCFFLAFFWLQLWTTFEWGGCREYNEKTNSKDCMSPEFLQPVWGKAIAVVPSFAQGFAFEMVSGLSKLSVDILVSTQSWQSNDEMRSMAASYYLFLEVVGKLGFICVLGFLYVPDYGGDELGCTGRLDFWFLGNWSFSCLKLNVPRALRLQLFLSSVKGPFLTSGVLGIFKKTLLPILIERLRALENLAPLLECLVRCSIAVLRLLMLLLYCDWHAQDAGAGATLRRLPTLSAEPRALDALAEARRRPFEPLEECVELLLHFMWTSCFVAVYPLGGVLAFANQALELRFDVLKLLVARRRPWPRPAGAEKEWLPRCAHRIVHTAIVMNVLVLALPFALVAQDCGGVLVVESPCSLTTLLSAILGIAALEIYWYILSWLMRCWHSESPRAGAQMAPEPGPMEVVPCAVSAEKRDTPHHCCAWLRYL